MEVYLRESPCQCYPDMFLRLKHKEIPKGSSDILSDEKLVSQYLETGNKEKIAELFERYTHLVYGICLNYLQDADLSKDAVMDIFESLFHKLAVHSVTNFRNWLYSVARNHCLMAIRKAATVNRAKHKIKEETDEMEQLDFLNESEDTLLNKNIIGSAVEKLSHEQGTCIRLMYIDDKSYKDISVITGYSMKEVKSHIQNGKRNLKNYLRNSNDHTDL